MLDVLLMLLVVAPMIKNKVVTKIWIGAENRLRKAPRPSALLPGPGPGIRR